MTIWLLLSTADRDVIAVVANRGAFHDITIEDRNETWETCGIGDPRHLR